MNLFKNWQGLTALIVAITVFFLSPFALRLIDPTAGAFDPGYLQRPVLAFVYLSFGHFVLWVLVQLDWKTLDHWLDADGFRKAWSARATGPQFQMLFAAAVLALELFAYIACLFAVPV